MMTSLATLVALSTLTQTAGAAPCVSNYDCAAGLVCTRTGCAAHQRINVRTERRGIRGLIISGPIVFGSMYLISIATTAIISSINESSQTGKNIGYSVVPVLGPMLQLADIDGTDSYAPALIASSLVQLAGLTMTIVGLSVRRTVQVPLYGDAEPETPSWAVVPLFGDASGLAFAKSF